MHDRAMHLAVVSLVVVVMCVCCVTLVVCMEIIVKIDRMAWGYFLRRERWRSSELRIAEASAEGLS